jgi:hypothetical protein
MPDMQPWEFLIQQDGDRAWLPLDTADVEILEGRYRIAAKSSLKNAPVSVRVRYDAIDEIPPKRRTQTRTQQTSEKGLMVVIPYTTLLPGLWEFQCTSETGTVHSIQLKVLSISSDLVEDWNPDWEDAEHATLEFVAPALESNLSEPLEPKETSADLLSIDAILHDAETESGSIADEILREYGLVSESPHEDFRAPQNPMLPDSAVTIALVQDTFISNRGEPLTIAGQITSEELSEIHHAELRICLRDPQSSKMLLETREMLQNEALPFQLKYRVTLPVELKTQVILGEITLHDLRVEGHPALATQSFILMSDVDELVDAMHEAKQGDRTMAEDMLDLPTTRPTAAHPPLNLTFLNFVAAAKESEGTNFTVKESSSLPPQLRQPNPYVRRKLDLPTFGIQPDVANPEDTDGTQLEIPLTSAFLPLEVTPEPIQEPEPTEVEELYLAPLEESAPTSDLKVQAEDRDFIPETAALNLQPSSDEVVNEFVVDDEPILPLSDLIISRRNHSIESERARNPLLLPETEPVPDPTVLIAEPELIGGKSTTVRLKLPDIVPKIYAKLWVSDRQNRNLIEPSRWIIDFKPDGHGNLEATTEIKVPFDCIEIQVEAIAVEVMTNRESHKVVVTRRVVPEELPDLWLDNLDTDSISL